MTGDERKLLDGFADLASRAGAVIMACRGTRGALKPDGSPVCAGDRRSEDVILHGLTALAPQIPVISEESFAPGTARPERFVLVDPLDGTREFLDGSDDFTVNIAVIEAGRPVLGCVYAPAHGRLWLGGDTTRHYRLKPGEPLAAAGPGEQAQARPWQAGTAVALTSRSHVSEMDRELGQRLGAGEARAVGSSLKFALIASGEADLYPRAGRVMAWDIAAGHAVLAAAGGSVVTLEGAPLDYRKVCTSWSQQGFIALGDRRALAALAA